MLIRVLAVTLAFVFLGCSGDPNAATSTGNTESSKIASQAQSDRSWSLSDIQDIGIEGVSPELIKDSDGNFLLLATSISNKRVYVSKDGVNFTTSNESVPMGSDYSVIQKSDGTFLLYFVGFDMQPPAPNQAPQGDPNNPSQNQPVASQQSKKKVFVSTSKDLKTFSEPVFTGIEQKDETPAWGVPDTYTDLEGHIKMMWVEMIDGERDEVLLTATSTDGISFTRDEGIALKGGYVDPYMLQVKENDWILLLSTTPDPRKLPQKLFIAYSSDGKNWQVEPNPLLEEAEANNLDPTAVQLSENTWRIIYSRVDLDKALSGPYFYQSALLELTR